MNLQEELKALKERIAELEEQVKEEQEFPQHGDTYWCINAFGGLSKQTWDGYDIEKDMLEIGNGFRTEQEAEFAVEKLKVEAELRKFSTEYQPYTELHTIVFHNNSRKVITVTANQSIQDITIYFESEEIALHAIQSVGEGRIRKYIFGLES